MSRSTCAARGEKVIPLTSLTHPATATGEIFIGDGSRLSLQVVVSGTLPGTLTLKTTNVEPTETNRFWKTEDVSTLSGTITSDNRMFHLDNIDSTFAQLTYTTAGGTGQLMILGTVKI